jgi:hypothetical protein
LGWLGCLGCLGWIIGKKRCEKSVVLKSVLLYVDFLHIFFIFVPSAVYDLSMA